MNSITPQIIIDWFGALIPLHQLMMMSVVCVVVAMVVLLVKLLKSKNGQSEINKKLIESFIEPKTENPTKPTPSRTNEKHYTESDEWIRSTPPTIGMRIKDGVTTYSRHFALSEAELQRRANKLTQKEAWEGLRKSFWNTRRNSLKRFQPEIYNEIMYWENNIEEYFVYMGMKLLFDLPYKTHDFWVRRSQRSIRSETA